MRDNSARAAAVALLLLSCQRATEVRGSEELADSDGALITVAGQKAVVFAAGGGTCDRLREGPLRESALVLKLPEGPPGSYPVPAVDANTSERVAGAYLRKPQSEPACVSDILLASDGTLVLTEVTPDRARGSFDLWFGANRHYSGQFDVRRCAIPASVEPCY
jgi:hypothetical protein